MRSTEEYERQKKAIRVSLETADGKKFDAELVVFQGETLLNTMNGHAPFIRLYESDGTISLIAKSFIRRIVPSIDEDEKENTPLGGGKWSHHSEDPYLVLDVPRHASDEEVRNAYHGLVRLYHPDKLASQGLPPVMMDYGEEILKKINAAYEVIMFQRRNPSSSDAA